MHTRATGGLDDGAGGGYIDPLSPQPTELPYWTLELAFPLHGTVAHGGLLDGARDAAHPIDMQAFGEKYRSPFS